MAVQKTLITADELFRMPDDGKRYELVEGELRPMAPAGGERGFVELAPDLVVEVVSPSDTAERIEEQVHDWLRVGVRLVLVAYSSTRSVTAYRSMTDVRVLTAADELDADDVLPGFRCPVHDLFPG